MDCQEWSVFASGPDSVDKGVVFKSGIVIRMGYMRKVGNIPINIYTGM